MGNASYTTLTRQSGLMAEMRLIANNIANAATTGYRSEGVIFSEYVSALGPGHDSLSMARAAVRDTDISPGGMTATGGAFDLAIEGEGFFLVQTPGGERLTRAGHFMPNANGDLVTPDGYPVLDAGGAPLFVPPAAASVTVAPDGVLSADGQPLGQVGVVRPRDPAGLVREDGVRFRAEGGFEPVPRVRVAQGFLEESNVDPILQVARMIEVQRAYELGQRFLEQEDERLRGAIRATTGS
ncbi:putative flagellar basal body rod protein [Oceanicola granulosus HTCC2516]|uniref:Flagellar basal-body rod protein FlgF n=1 Tax=Oceanicola granulosus (strain ATCC BAA-861 / DSM 15982 / KCTC 12143 / HTCC2516) TaxID=314256 RepID=Q2CDH5_OCEGH|nr:flagellar hook-basal body complex protein [Oceanicola granulosus]EAR50736.1 putative flagellar basal body rod protein [Oceanicola granulosus HTCC2516]